MSLGFLHIHQFFVSSRIIYLSESLCHRWHYFVPLDDHQPWFVSLSPEHWRKMLWRAPISRTIIFFCKYEAFVGWQLHPCQIWKLMNDIFLFSHNQIIFRRFQGDRKLVDFLCIMAAALNRCPLTINIAVFVLFITCLPSHLSFWLMSRWVICFVQFQVISEPMTFIFFFGSVSCPCHSCNGKKHTLTEWERHTGCRSKKWKSSVKVKSTMVQLSQWVRIWESFSQSRKNFIITLDFCEAHFMYYMSLIFSDFYINEYTMI